MLFGPTPIHTNMIKKDDDDNEDLVVLFRIIYGRFDTFFIVMKKKLIGSLGTGNRIIVCA